MKKDHVDIGYIDIPKEYFKLTPKRKKVICNNIIDTLLRCLERDLDPTINRITFLDEILESSIESNNDLEQYEVSAVLNDCRKQLTID
jgi:predicted transcriptional regulator